MKKILLVLFCFFFLSLNAFQLKINHVQLNSLNNLSNKKNLLPSRISLSSSFYPISTSRYSSNTATITSPSTDSDVKTISTIKKSSMSSSTFNLAKSIIGAGVLSLPGGVSLVSSNPNFFPYAAVLCVIFGLVASYTFKSLGFACDRNKTGNLSEAWRDEVSKKGVSLISISVTALCFLASLAYNIIIGDSFTSLAKTFNLNPAIAKRTPIILLIASFILLPLTSLRSLASLAPFSILGLTGMLYTLAFMTKRMLDGTYAPGGKFYSTLSSIPFFSLTSQWNYAGIFILLSMLSTSFIAHYSASKFYTELEDATPKRYSRVVSLAFTSAIIFFLSVMFVGYFTFGGSTSSFVLLNYSISDPLASISRFAIGIALLTSYPFAFSGLREGILDFFNVKSQEDREKNFMKYTLVLSSILTSLAIVLKDVGFVVSLSGSTFGCFLMFLVPAFFNIAHAKKLLKENSSCSASSCTPSTCTSKESNGKLIFKIFLNSLMGIFGIVLSVIGVSVNVLKQIGKL